MLGFSSVLTAIIQGLRIAELRLSTRFRKLLCVRVFFGTSMSTVLQILITSLLQNREQHKLYLPTGDLRCFCHQRKDNRSDSGRCLGVYRVVVDLVAINADEYYSDDDPDAKRGNGLF